jgi:hypothetical protein
MSDLEQQQEQRKEDDAAPVAQEPEPEVKPQQQQATKKQAVAEIEQHTGKAAVKHKEDYQAPEAQRLRWLQGEHDALIKLVKSGKISASEAISDAERYDKHINSGQPSIEGAMMIAQLGIDLVNMAVEDHRKKFVEEEHTETVPPQVKDAPPPQQQQQPVPQQQVAPPQQQQQHADPVLEDHVPGIAEKETTGPEAKVLHAIRANDRRFDPVWLQGAQQALNVRNADGAFDTETLRAMRKFANDPKLSASEIMREGFLVKIHAGSPFMAAATAMSFGPTGKQDPSTVDKPDDAHNTAADKAARGLGYADYATYKGTWQTITILGQGVGKGHPHLVARVKAADAYLRNLHPGMSPADIRKAIGWNGDGNGAYHDDASLGVAHLHTMGLAVDIDPRHNPWIFRGKKIKEDHKPEQDEAYNDQGDVWYEKVFAIAARVYGGEGVTAKKLYEWGQDLSTEEMLAKVKASDAGIEKYFHLCGQDEDTRRAELKRAKFDDQEIAELLPKMPGQLKIFHSTGRKQQNAQSMTNLHNELVIALRDAAGLAWGGTDFPGGNQEGDFMHFDCHNDSFGKTAYDLGRKFSKS